ncbi:16S rRNA (uracil(1498)-N(3))-methyltransferase [Flavobacteriaceae bacterium]|jgi:16S rRNA (uracil1498-N3)-methyltransferase|nr:16S rRNA (uracil(1498)-N(3))-methyltransferase [Flavobacteriaceae bacterium]
MTLFFDPLIKESTKEFIFSREESKHLAKVIRKVPGDIIYVTNGKGIEWKGVLSFVSPQKTIASLKAFKKHPPKKYQIHLAIAPTKNNNRMEWLIEKLTELGVSSITPLLCDHSERKIIKKERLEKITISGLKQSQQFYLPKVNEMVSFKDFVIASKKQETYIAHCEESPKENLDAISFKGTSQTVMIGPEGDFSHREIKEAVMAGIKAVSIGKQRFRSETAGLFACHTIFLKQHESTKL